MADGGGGCGGPEEYDRFGEQEALPRSLVGGKQLNRKVGGSARVWVPALAAAVGLLVHATQWVGYAFGIGFEDEGKKPGSSGKVEPVGVVRQGQVPEPVERPERIRGVEVGGGIGDGCEFLGVLQRLRRQHPAGVLIGGRADKAVADGSERLVTAVHSLSFGDSRGSGHPSSIRWRMAPTDRLLSACSQVLVRIVSAGALGAYTCRRGRRARRAAVAVGAFCAGLFGAVSVLARSPPAVGGCVRFGVGDGGRVRERLGSLCADLSRWASLDGIIRGAGAGPELDELLTAIGGQGPDPKRARVLLDAIEEACKRGGLDVLPRGSRLRPLPPGTSLSSGGESWVCPRGFCDRVVLAEEADAPPVCAAAGGMPMKRWVLP